MRHRVFPESLHYLARRIFVVSLIASSYPIFFTEADDNFTKVLACEGETASLKCPSGYHIIVHIANFGRFSLNPCNPTMNLDINIKCLNVHTIDVLRARCDHRQRCVLPVNWGTFRDTCPGTPKLHERCDHHESCTVPATTDLFRDSCPGTPKYLDSQHDCVRKPGQATTTTSTTSTTTTPVLMELALVGNDKTESTGDKGNLSHRQQEDPGGGPSTRANNWCQPRVTHHHLQWPRSLPSQTVHVPCPVGTRGRAEWKCSAMDWSPRRGPDLSGCVSTWARELRDDLEEEDSKDAQPHLLLDSLREAHKHVRTFGDLVGGDLIQIGVILDQVTRRRHATVVGRRRLDASVEKSNESQKETLEIVRLIIDTIRHLLRSSQHAAWSDLPSRDSRRLASSLLRIGQESLVLLLPLASWPKAGSESILAEFSLLAEVSSVAIYDQVPFPSMSLYRTSLDTAILPRETLQLHGQDLANVVYLAYERIGDYLSAVDADSEEIPKELVIVSRVVSLSLVGPLVHSPPTSSASAAILPPRLRALPRPISLTFHNLPVSKVDVNSKGFNGRLVNPRCVWWDSKKLEFVANDGEAQTERCWISSRNETHTTCECSHLNAHYAVAMDLVAGEDPSFMLFNDQMLLVAFYVSCAIAAICMVLSVLVLFVLVLPSEKCHRLAIHRHVCALLLLIELALFFGLFQTESQILCSVVAGFLHFLFLAILCWTLIDAFQLCHSVDQLLPDGNCQSPVIQKLYLLLFGYGFPLLLVAISVLWKCTLFSSDSAFYASPDFCWLDRVNYAFVAFLGPAAILLASIIACLVKTLSRICPNASRTCSSTMDAKKTTANGYQPCGQSRRQQKDELRLRKALCEQFKTTALLIFLLALVCTSGTLWTAFSEGDVIRLSAGWTFVLSNISLGIAFLATHLFHEPMTRRSFLNWRKNGMVWRQIGRGRTADERRDGVLSLADKDAQSFPTICPLQSPGHDTEKPSNTEGHFTLNSSSSNSATSANGGGTSACSEVSTDCLVSSGNNETLPTPPPLLQRLHQHQQQQRLLALSQSEGGLVESNPYEYETIPYEELLNAYHQQQQQQQNRFAQIGGRCLPSTMNKEIRHGYETSGTLPIALNSPHLRFPYGQYRPGMSPLGSTYYGLSSQFDHQCSGEGHPSAELGLRSVPFTTNHLAPPKFPPPPPPAEGIGSGSQQHVYHRHPPFFESPSGMRNSGRISGSTVVRMDLSRATPIYSEQLVEIIGNDE